MLYVWDTQAKPAVLKEVAITVAASADTWVSAADVELVGWKLIWVLPTWNQDQFVDNVEIAADWVVTVTLAANATADNTFNVVVARITWDNA